MQNKTHWKKAFNSNYLSTCDIETEQVLTIKEVKLETVTGTNGDNQLRNIAYFKENFKPMVLNVGNSKTVKNFAKSKYIEDWKNILVKVYSADNIKAFGEVVEGLRIRTVQPNLKKDDLNPKSHQWLKAVSFLKSGNCIEDIKKKYSLTKQNEKLLLEQSKT